MGLVNSYLGLPYTRDERVESAIANNSAERGGRFAYFMQILGQTYINLGQCDRAISLLQKALEFAKSGHYKQVEGRILTGMAEIYRLRGDFQQANACHASAADLLEQIGAKCDLAEALLQQALTEREMGNAIASQEHFARSIQLFEALQSPKQIEKVTARMARSDRLKLSPQESDRHVDGDNAQL